ncbi:MAG: response regulator [Candidatus Margulisbacteria bacterium]|nr:response regulator [Candidatus Margulisiibacteriota bacterium]
MSEEKPLILLVEDEKDMADGIVDILKHDYELLIANTGQKALQLLEFNEYKISAVLLDISLPDISGIELIEQIRAITLYPEIIMVTAHEHIASVIETMKQGAYDYITKPFQKPELLSVLKRTLEKVDYVRKLESVLNQNIMEGIDIDRRLTLSKEFIMKRLLKGEQISPEELTVFFPPPESRKKLSLKELKSELETDVGEKAPDAPILKILVVEDEADMRQNIIDILNTRSYSFIEASTGYEALDLIEKHNDIDLILLDIGLPDISGLEVLLKIKSLDKGHTVITISAYSDKDTVIETLQKGAFDYVLKPFEASTLLSVIQRISEKRHYENILPMLSDKLQSQTFSHRNRISMLNDMCKRLINTSSPLKMKDVYIFFPEFKNKEYPPDKTIMPLTINSGLETFIDELKKKHEKEVKQSV